MNFAHIHRPRKSKSAASDESRLLGCRRPPLAASVGRLLRDFLNDFSSSAASQIGRETDVPSLPFSLSFLPLSSYSVWGRPNKWFPLLPTSRRGTKGGRNMNEWRIQGCRIWTWAFLKKEGLLRRRPGSRIFPNCVLNRNTVFRILSSVSSYFSWNRSDILLSSCFACVADSKQCFLI